MDSMFDNGKFNYITRYTNDSAGRPLSYYCIRNNDTISWNETRYDSYGNSISEHSFSAGYSNYKPSHNIRVYEYEYDALGNFTKQTKYEIIRNKRVPKEMTIYRYVYY